MIDQYPDDFAKFIAKREKAKRMRKEADALWKEAENHMNMCLGFFDDEPLYPIPALADIKSSIQSSPANEWVTSS